MPDKLIIDNFLGGIAPSQYVGDVRSQADPGPPGGEHTMGFEPNYSGSVGILRRGFQRSTLTNESIFQGLVQFRKQVMTNGNPYLYLLGQDDNTVENKLFQIDLQTHTAANNATFPHVCAGAFGVGLGLELFGKYLYYASGRNLGRFDLSITFNDSFNISLSTAAYGGGTINHPMVAGNGKLFVGNVDTAGNAVISTVDSADVVQLVALDLTKTGQFVKALEFADTSLYIGMSYDKDNSSNSNVESFLYVWDTVSAGYQQRFRFPQGNITCIRATAKGIFVFGRNAAFRFTGSGFEPIYQNYSGGPNVHGADFSPNGQLFWKTGTGQIVYSFGSVDPALPEVVNRPYRSMGAEGGFLKWVDNSNFYVSGFSSAPMVRRFSAGGTAGYGGDGEWWTPIIQFPDRCRFARITIYTLPLAADTTVGIYWGNKDGSALTQIATMQQATAQDPGFSKFQFTADGLIDYAWQIKLAHTAGETPSIRRIEIEYDIEKE